MFREFWERTRTREAVGVLLAGLTALLALSLISYSPDDRSLFVAASERPSNWIGPVGADAAAVLFNVLGLASWFLPLAFLAASVRCFQRGRGRLGRSGAVGFVIVAVATAALLGLLVGQIDYRGAAMPAGGMLGFIVGRALTGLLSDVGALIVVGAAVLVGLILAARSSLAMTAGAAAGTVGRTLRPARPGFKRFLQALRPRWPAFLRRRPKKPRVGPPARAPVAPAPTPPAPAAALAPAEVLPEPLPPADDEAEEVGAAAAADDAAASVPAVAPAEASAEGAVARRRARLAAKERQARLPVDIPAPPTRLPPVELLSSPPPQPPPDRQELLTIARQIESRCHEFAVEGRVLEIHPGPVVTTYEYRPDAGIKLSRVTALADDLALALEAESIRIDRIPGRPTVGIEVPNRQRQVIYLREVLEADPFRKSGDLLTVALGKTQEGEIATASLSKMPHLLIAGATGSGKSVGLNGIITSILHRARPDQVRFILIDPKMLELGLYDGIPHLLVPVVTDMKQASNALHWAVREMERRYRVLASCNTRHLDAFNRLVERERSAVEKALASIPARGPWDKYEAKPLPYVIIIVDELADMLVTAEQDTEESIARLAQKARAVGLHLVLATQRPSVDVLTGSIKANFPARIAYRVASKIDSRTILDASGAERLLGAGDMLYRQPGGARLQRIHGAMVAEDENLRVVAWLKNQAKAEYDKSILADPPEAPGEAGDDLGAIAANDPVYRKAVGLIVSTGQASTSFLQRRMRLGYSRAARIIDQMEQDGIVSAADGARPRQVLVDNEYLQRMDLGAE